MMDSLLKRIENNKKAHTRWLAMILCLSMLVSLGTFAGFHKTAVAKTYTKEVLDCPFAQEGASPVAHVHNDDCYDGDTLVCTLPEREAHTHTEECFAEQRRLTCVLEENPGHQHSDACYAAREEITCGLEENPGHVHNGTCFNDSGVLICTMAEGDGAQTHTADCFTTVYDLICDIPAGEGAHTHTDECYTTERVQVCGQEELPVHVHGPECIRTVEWNEGEDEPVVTDAPEESTIPEMPVSDPDADLESVEDWNREFENLELSGNWARDLIYVAATQQGRGESPNNFEAFLNDAGDAWVRYGYTRYGAWYGVPYAEEWSAMFVSFCLRYAGIPAENVPNNPTAAFMAESFQKGELFAGRDYVPAVGDLIFFDTVVDDDIVSIDHMGIVYHVDAEDGTINTVEGDRTNAVATFGYHLDDEQIVGYGILPQNPNYIPAEEENTEDELDGLIVMTEDEEEEPEETPAAEDVTAPAVPMPAQSWERTAGGIKVSVEAPEGAFPENTSIAVTPVNGNRLKDTVSDAVSGKVLEVQAVDITFFDAEGNEIEPAIPIRVTMTPAATQHAEEKASVVHVDVAEQTAELIEQAAGTEFDNSEVVFDADAFTIYAIVYTYQVEYEYEVDGKTFTSSMPGAENMSLTQIVQGLGIVGEEELETFVSKIASIASSNEEVAVVNENNEIRVLKDGEAKIVITMQDGAKFHIDVRAEGETSASNETATVSTKGDLYLPADAELKTEVLDEVKSENAIAAVEAQEGTANSNAAAAETAYQVFDISLENVEADQYNGFQVEVKLPEGVVGKNFRLYHVHDGKVDELKLDNTAPDGETVLLESVSFVTPSFSHFVLSYTVDFEYNGKMFSIYGGSSFPLADVLAMLGINLPNEAIQSAVFTDESLVHCTQENGIWMLYSTGAFSTEERLIVTAVDGTVYVINVTDAATIYENVEYGNLTDFVNTIGVRVNGTNLNNPQDRDKVLNLTFNYSMLFANADAARGYYDEESDTYNWYYDLSAMADEYPEISSFPNLSGTLRNGREVLGTYIVRDNKVYLNVYGDTLGDSSTHINGEFTINMALDEEGTGTENSTQFNFPGGGSFTVKYKPVEYEEGTKTANPINAQVYPDQFDGDYYYIDYTAQISEKYALNSLTFSDVLGPNQELVPSSIKVNGNAVSGINPAGNINEGQSFSFDVLSVLGVSPLPANENVIVTYKVRIPKETIEQAKANGTGVTVVNDADWNVNNTPVPGGDTTVTVTEQEYTNPTKSIKNTSSTDNGGKVVNPNGEKKDNAVIADQVTMLNDDGTYHISYSIDFSEPAVPKSLGLTDNYGSNQSLLIDSFTVTYNGQKYSIPSSYISDNNGSFRIDDLKGAIQAATGADYTAGTQYSINYETSVTAENFNKEITNASSLIIDKEYRSNDTTIELTSSDFQPGTKHNTSGKNILLKNGLYQEITSWEIRINEPKDASTKAQLTDTYPADSMELVDGSFVLNINGTDYTVSDSYINKASGEFSFDLNKFLSENSSIDENYVKAGRTYTLKYQTKNKSSVFTDIKSDENSNSKTLTNTANWIFSDDNEDHPETGGHDDVTYTIPDYKPTGKSDSMSGNVSNANGRYGDATKIITGEGPYTITYTITVPAQDLDLTSANLTDTYTTNQTIDWNSFRINGTGLTNGAALTHETAGQFELNLLSAMGISTLEAGTPVTIEYTATTSVLNEDIENHSYWVFNNEYNDGHDTKEKLVEPNYEPGSKSVYNENENREVTINNGEKYDLDWTLTITEPVELNKAVLHDDYSTGSKDHILIVDADHPMVVQAGNRTITITDLSQYSSAITSADGSFDIDMVKLFGLSEGETFPANTTFTVQYTTQADGETVPQQGKYSNTAKWDFDSPVKEPEKDIPGGNADTTLKTKEYNDGTKTSYYNGERLYGGTFTADGDTTIQYKATMEQDEPVENMFFRDTWHNEKVKLVYPVVVKDSNGDTVATFNEDDASGRFTATSTGFYVQLVKDGKLPDESDFETGVTYTVEYSLDFTELADENGDFNDVEINNDGHWHTDGDLPDHDDDHTTPDKPQSPEWQPISKEVSEVRYNSSVLDQSGKVWYSDDYTGGSGTVYIDYTVTLTEPRPVTGLLLTDITNIPAENSEIASSPAPVVTVKDAGGNPATWGQLLGTEDDTLIGELTPDLTANNQDGKLGFTTDIISLLQGQSAAAGQTVTFPKNYTVELTFTAALKDSMEPATSRLDTEWRNDITAKFNNTHEETDDDEATIKTRLKLEKEFYEVTGEPGSEASTKQENGARLNAGTRVKYVIKVGNPGDSFTDNYTITDELTNFYVQAFDWITGVKAYAGASISDGVVSGTEITGVEPQYSWWHENAGNRITGFSYTIPGTAENPIAGPVYLVYYVDVLSQEEATAMNEANASNSNWVPIYNVMVENNTARSQEEKEVTTTYDVMYDKGHEIRKDFTKWDDSTGTAYWKVTVTTLTGTFPAGYKITEDQFKYTASQPSGYSQTDEYNWTDREVAAASDMSLDLSKIIVTRKYNRGNSTDTLVRDRDYRVEGNSIVMLTGFDDVNTNNTELVVSNIRTTIPGWNSASSSKQYFYNDASFRTGNDELLDEDDANEDTDATPLIQKKYGWSEEGKDGNLYFYWNITITPPKSGNLNNLGIYEGGNYALDMGINGVSGNVLNSDGTDGNSVTMQFSSDAGGVVSVVNAKTNQPLTQGSDYTVNGNLGFSGTVKFGTTNITDPVIITVKTLTQGSNEANKFLSADKYKVKNTVSLLDETETIIETASDEKVLTNTDIGIDKSVSEAGDLLEVTKDTKYPTLKSLGNDIYEYTVEINPEKKPMSGSATFTDLLPAGFELVDWNGDAEGNPNTTGRYVNAYWNGTDNVSTTVDNTDHDVYFKGYINAESYQNQWNGTTDWYCYDFQNPDNQIDLGNNKRSDKWLTPIVTPDYMGTGRTQIRIDNINPLKNGTNPVIKYKVRLTEAEQVRLQNIATGAIQYYENNATVTCGFRSNSDSETLVYRYDEALDKRDVTTAEEASIGDINYVVYVNNEIQEGVFTPRTLNGGDPLTLTDKIATSLELNRAQIKVYKDIHPEITDEADPAWDTKWQEVDSAEYSVSYNSDSRNLTFKLADATHFKVVIPAWAEDATEDVNGDGDISPEEAVNGWYKNTVTLVGEGKFEDTVDEPHIVYSTGGSVENFKGNAFRIDKFDENHLTKQLQGATFSLYEVTVFDADAEHPDWPESYVIPDESEWRLIAEKTTDRDGFITFDNLITTTPGTKYPRDYYTETKRNQSTGWEQHELENTHDVDGPHVVLYAWKETKLSDALMQEGYTIGENSEPHFVILYYTAKSEAEIQEKIAHEQYDATYSSLTEDQKRAIAASVASELQREKQKALSSYDITASFDFNYQDANYITISSSRNGYTWPVPNANQVSKTVRKLWDDHQNIRGLRPKANQITVQLYQNDIAYGSEVTLKDTSLSVTNAEYSYTWEGLPATDSNGEPYIYTVEETYKDDNYIATYSADTFTITNHLVDETTVVANKIWNDDNNRERLRPRSIYYQLYQMDDFGGMVPYGDELEGKADNNFSVKWENLPQVDDEDDPTTGYTYFALEVRMQAMDGTTYWLDDATGKFYAHEGNVESGAVTGEPLYVSETENEGNIYTITNTAVSRKTGSVKLTKTLTGLVGNHSEISTGLLGPTADKKLYSVVLRNSDGYAIKAVPDDEHSIDTLKIYTYSGLQESTDDFTTFEISETVSVQINDLPLASYSYSAIEDTTGNVAIKDYEFDASPTGGSVTTVSVRPNEGNNNPAEANLINHYIPDKGSISITKTVRGLPEGIDLAAYRFPVVIYTTKQIDTDGDEVADTTVPDQYVNADGSLTDVRIIHHVTPGTVLEVTGVPIGTYTVEELLDDAVAPMPDLTASSEDVNVQAQLQKYELSTGSSTTELAGVKVTKNGNRQETLVNQYVKTTGISVVKIWKNESDQEVTGWPEGVEITLSLYQNNTIFGTFRINSTGVVEAKNGSNGDFEYAYSWNADQRQLSVTKLPQDRNQEYSFKETSTGGYNASYAIKIVNNDTGEERIVGKTSGDTDRAQDGEYIVNRPEGGVELPQTGGIGTTLFTALGGLMTATAGAILTMKSYRRWKENA